MIRSHDTPTPLLTTNTAPRSRRFLLERLLLFACSFLVCLAQPSLLRAQGGSSDGGIKERRLTKKPTIKKQVQPDYPDEALKKRVEGTVKLKITIDKAGKVTDVKILDDPGAGLGEAAAKAVKQFEFTPAEINDKPAAIILPFAIDFQLPVMPSSFVGEVIDARSKKGLKGATITIQYKGKDYEQPPTAKTTTDAAGKFGFFDVPPGEYEVKLELGAYQSYTTAIKLVPGKRSEATYKVQAKPENFTGVVLEAGSRKPLPGMSVELTSIKTGKLVNKVFTGAKGQFSFKGIDPGRYNLRIDGEGYIAGIFVESLKADEILENTYYLEAEYYDEYAIKTTAKRQRREVNKRTLRLEEVRRVPGTAGDVVRVVQNLPGVARPRFLGGQIIVRGAAPQDTQIFLEGDPIPSVFHFLGGPAIINSEMIESIDFIPGNFSTYYGRATAAIIDLRARSPRNDGYHGHAEVDFIDASLLLEGPITDKISFAISARRSYIDTFLPFIIPEDTFDAFVAPRYYDYQGWLTYRSGGDHLVEAFLYGSNDRLELLFADAEDQQVQGLDLNNGFHRGQLRWEYRPAEAKLENTLMASLGTNLVTLELLGALNVRVSYFQNYIRDDLKLQINDKLQLRTGADFLFGNGRGEVEFLAETGAPAPDQGMMGGDDMPMNMSSGGDNTPGFTYTEPLMSLAYYAELLYKPFDRLELLPGVRLDFYGTIADFSASPRFSTRFKLLDTLTLKGGVGLFTQAPQPNLTIDTFGNPNLLAEKAMQYAVGSEWKPFEHIELDTTLFYRDLFDLTVQSDALEVDTSNPNAEIGELLYSNEGTGRAFGLEVLLRWYPYKRFFGWIAYTLSRSERRPNADEPLAIYQFDQTHIFTMIGGYNLPWGVDISARFRIVSGYPFTPIVGSVFNAGNGNYSPVNGTLNSAREQLFHQLDLRVDKKFVFNTWRLGIYVDITNAYNRTNQEGVTYNYDYTERDIISGLPIIPSLGVNAKW